MVVFNFDVQWCTCGKPMSVGCHEDVPDDYFDNISFEAAKCAHYNAMCIDTYKSAVRFGVHRIDEGIEITITLNELPISFTVRSNIAMARIQCHEFNRMLWPLELTRTQCLALENNEWQDFVQQVNRERFIDILCFDVQTHIQLRMIASVSKDGRIIRTQINANGRVYFDTHTSQQPPIPCPWTSILGGEVTRVSTPLGVVDCR